MIYADMFAGGGGTTSGALMVNDMQVAWAINHCKHAIQTQRLNNPNTKHYWANVEDMDLSRLEKTDGLWASLECTNFSSAKGGMSRDADSRAMAWELVPYVKHTDPTYITIENVREFLDWGPLRIKCDKENSTSTYSALAIDPKGKFINIPVQKKKGKDYKIWVEAMRALGYPNYEYRILNAADYGAHTSRRRLFIQFSKKGFPIRWPKPTHDKNGRNGLPKWLPCKELIDLYDEGHSIFGREFNFELPTHLRRPLADKTLKRIAGGIKRFCPEFLKFIMKYYGTGDNTSSLNEPLHTITTKDRHAIVSIELEKNQFLTDHIWGANNQSVDTPMNTICTKESKQLVTIEQFVSDGTYGNENKVFSLENPMNTITTQQRHQLITTEKEQFLSHHFSGFGKPENSNSSLDKPMHTIMTNNKAALSTCLMNGTFDIKMRFLNWKELARITGFDDAYKFVGSNKKINWLIGNAVPTKMAQALLTTIKETFDEYKDKQV